MHACAYTHVHAHILTYTHTPIHREREEERGGREEGRNRQFHLKAEIETLSLLNVQVFGPKKIFKIAQRSYMERDKGEGR